jgi:hypothetical protein
VRRSEAIFNIVLQFGLPLTAIAIGCLFWLLTSAPLHYIFIMLLFWAVGFSMFLKAKLSVIRQSKLMSFGPRGMSRTNRIFYLLGYIIMTAGLLLLLVFSTFYRVR